MTKILLIRHALTDTAGKVLTGRMEGIGLNEQGFTQAGKLSERLAILKIDAIYSSPLQRAFETALEIAKKHHIQVTESEDFLEVDFGSWTNMRVEELVNDPVFRQFNSLRSITRIPGGEYMPDAQLRIISGIKKICDQHKNETVAVVSHADMIRSVIAFYAGIPLDLMNRLEISPASVSIIELDDNYIKLMAINMIYS